MIDQLLNLTIVFVFFPFFIYPAFLFFLWIIYKIIPIHLIQSENIIESKINPIFNKDFCLVLTCNNEEKTIRNKIENIVSVWDSHYDLNLIILNDGSTDKTSVIARNCELPNYIKLSIHNLERLGKTAAQNWFVQNTSFDIYLFTDAIAKFDKYTLKLLLARFDDDKVGYCSANLILNSSNSFGRIENIYWEFDKWLRRLESDIASSVGGNGALYGVRRTAYSMLPPILSHDGFMPTEVVIKGFKAAFCRECKCFEKSAKKPSIEFMRRVRMNRGLPMKYFYNLQKFNFFKYGWFSLFYFGHKFTKAMLFMTHTLMLILSFLALGENIVAEFIVWAHLGLLLLLLIGVIKDNKLSGLIRSYSIAFAAQWVATLKTFSGKTRATWERTSER